MTKAKVLLMSEKSSLIRGFIIAVGSVAIALGIDLFLFSHKIEGVQFPVFLFAIAVSAWYGGARPAILALVLSTLAFDYYFTIPYNSFYLSQSDIPFYVIFILFALLITWFSALRRREERRTAESQKTLQKEVTLRSQQASLLNLTHDPIFVRDMNGVITYWNRGAQELYGWTPEQAAGKRTDDLLRTVFPRPFGEIQNELLHTGRWDGELQKTRANGMLVSVASRWSLQRDENNQPIAILQTENDITDRKNRETRIQQLNQELTRRSTDLEATNKELEAFAYSISHDLRAPLRHIAGYTQLLQKNSFSLLDEKGRRHTTMILEAAKRMGTLIDDLLSFSRIGRAQAHETMVSLDRLVREALNEVSTETEGRNVIWKIGSLPDLLGDRSMLKLVLVNLISNAVKFTRTREQPEIEIGCSETREDGVTVFVRDNGVGFDMKYVNKLFGVFQRLHRADEFEGTGIGLATVQRIIHRHGGQVWAEGLLGTGATFYLALPR